MRHLTLCGFWFLLTLAAAVHAGLATTYSRLCGEWLVDDGCDAVQVVDPEATKYRS